MNQKGFIAEAAVLIAVVVGVVWGFYTMTKIRWSPSESTASGVVYNVKNKKFISGNTSFRLRASEDTVVTEENISSYCLPKDSPYIELVNKASENKDIKVIVRTSKVSFRVVEGATTCVDNVVVEEKK